MGVRSTTLTIEVVKRRVRAEEARMRVELDEQQDREAEIAHEIRLRNELRRQAERKVCPRAMCGSSKVSMARQLRKRKH